MDENCAYLNNLKNWMVDESDIVESKVVEQWSFEQYPISLQKLKQFTFEMSS
jgi:hypothetical protein